MSPLTPSQLEKLYYSLPTASNDPEYLRARNEYMSLVEALRSGLTDGQFTLVLDMLSALGAMMERENMHYLHLGLQNSGRE